MLADNDVHISHEQYVNDLVEKINVTIGRHGKENFFNLTPNL